MRRDDDDDDSIEEHGGSSRDGNDHGTSSTLGFTPRIDELEILLESYFVQVDGTLNKLSTVRSLVSLLSFARHLIGRHSCIAGHSPLTSKAACIALGAGICTGRIEAA